MVRQGHLLCDSSIDLRDFLSCCLPTCLPVPEPSMCLSETDIVYFNKIFIKEMKGPWGICNAFFP